LTKTQLAVDQMSTVNEEWAKGNYNMLKSITDFSSNHHTSDATATSGSVEA
jgi:hypothetical protein